MRVSIGQDSHRFDPSDLQKPLLLGGVPFTDAPALSANSDGDVVLHALTNAVSGITGVNILGGPADELCRAGITDSREYLRLALESLDGEILHVSFSIECLTPRITPQIPQMRRSIAALLGIPESAVGVTATSGEGLTACGRGEGISVFCCLTVR